ncbi:DUF6473 family protein [Citreimonas sp.]|uniref:DUF6473 family protein n=1 Tax=Citreimonas sp. TaxID=3036715 RepID=UPI0035C83964
MGVLDLGRSGIDYDLCRYGDSRVRFRGPPRELDGDYVGFVGGTDTFGLFVPAPFPDLVEDEIGLACVNLGAVNAGADLFLNDPATQAVIRGARVIVLQVMGVQNLSNAYYSVHPRRNDRFLRASDALVSLFPEIEFTEFHYTRHMLSTLEAVSRGRYGVVLRELRATWERRMAGLIEAAGGPVILIRLSEGAAGGALADGAMLRRLADKVSAIVEVEAEPDPDPTWGMVFHPHEAAAARECLGAAAHDRAAEALIGPLTAALSRGA